MEKPDYLLYYEFEFCSICGSEMELDWCEACLGMGFFDEVDEDPVNFRQGEYIEICDFCYGEGSYPVCPNVANH